MEKIFNIISVIVGLIGGIAVYCFGSFDVLLGTMLVLTVFDYITGLLKAVALKRLSSEIGFVGLIKKVIMYIVIATAVVTGRLMGNIVPLREVVITFFICNEGLSLLENASEFVKIPPRLKEVLLQLREGENNGNIR